MGIVTQELSENLSQTAPVRKWEVPVARSILSVCILSLIFSLGFLSGTVLGFAVAFGSGIIGYEAYRVLRGISVKSIGGIKAPRVVA